MTIGRACIFIFIYIDIDRQNSPDHLWLPSFHSSGPTLLHPMNWHQGQSSQSILYVEYCAFGMHERTKSRLVIQTMVPGGWKMNGPKDNAEKKERSGQFFLLFPLSLFLSFYLNNSHCRSAGGKMKWRKKNNNNNAQNESLEEQNRKKEQITITAAVLCI